MKYNPDFHHRRSVRLKEYDYSKAGLYFITICCYKRECFFGEILKTGREQIMSLNKSGSLVKTCWLEIPLHFPAVVLHEFAVMPNHMHGIIEIVDLVGTGNLPPKYLEGARANVDSVRTHVDSERANVDAIGANVDAIGANVDSPLHRRNAEFKSPSKTIGSIIRGFKIGVTKWHRANTDIYNVWQRSYHDHVIRNARAHSNISKYIKNNPNSWDDDTFYIP